MANDDLSEQGKAALSKMRGQTAALLTPGSKEQQDYVAAQGNIEASRKPVTENFRKKSENEAAFAGTPYSIARDARRN